MASIDFRLDPNTKMAMSVGSLLDTLRHLRSVMAGKTFYLNSVKISSKNIRKSCEAYWYSEDPEHVGDGILDMLRLRSLIRFSELVNDLAKQPSDQYMLFNLRERLRSVLPVNNVNKVKSSHSKSPKSTSLFGSPYLDQNVLTASLISTLIRLCQLLESSDKSKEDTLHESILRNIQNRFVRPFCLILWSYGKKDLQV